MLARKILLISFMVYLFVPSSAQRDVIKGWHLLDKTTEGYQGISIHKTFDFLKGKTPHPIIVAVLDGGVDTTHPDLKPFLWHNPGERPGNFNDDDGNGFVDDVSGWNFLGNPNGENVEIETAEVIRLYHKLKPEFDYFGSDSASSTVAASPRYRLWRKINKQLEITPEEIFNLKIVQASVKTLISSDSILKAQWGINEYNIDTLELFKPQTPEAKRAKLNFLRFAELLQIDHDKKNVEIFEEVKAYIERQQIMLSARDMNPKYYRFEITGDSDDNMNSRHYGNSDVMGQNSLHGTHVSGIITGIMNGGIAKNANPGFFRILPVRMVPKGDEYDKDVALGIRYAVDNGAKVINMSFGKALSPNKYWIDEAIRYAQMKDVLIVHAAGNDGENLDSVENYPSPRFDDGKLAGNMITIGASGDSSLKCGMVAEFSNYGKLMVDVMAPGVKIYSTEPGGYGFEQGTSMAAPIVSGIAALIRSYYPGLTAVQVREIIEQSADRSLSGSKVMRPDGNGNKVEVNFEALSRTGGIVNACQAIILADATWIRLQQANNAP